MPEMSAVTTREEELAGQRWQRKTTIDEPRLSELVQAYRRIGCEVRLEPFDPSGHPDCNECMKTAGQDCKTIYVRQIGSGAAAVDDLF
jgi:hypothetical protein